MMYIPPDDTFTAERKTCHLLGLFFLFKISFQINILEKGVVAILGPLSKSASEHVRSITDNFEIPFIETR